MRRTPEEELGEKIQKRIHGSKTNDNRLLGLVFLSVSLACYLAVR